MAEPIPPPPMTPPVVAVHPAPSDDEAAAIVAALMLVSSGGAAGPEPGRPDGGWRFSGRWWSRPVPLVRQRPWRA